MFSAFSARVFCNLEPNFLHGFLKNGHWTGGKGLWAAFRIFSDTKKYPLNLYFGLVTNKKKSYRLSAVRICFYINKEGFLTPLCMTLRFYISEVFWLLPHLGLVLLFFFLAPPISDRFLLLHVCYAQYSIYLIKNKWVCFLYWSRERSPRIVFCSVIGA